MAAADKIRDSLAEHRLNKWYYERWQRDNKVEAPKVLAYLDGGPRPTDAEVPTHYGKGLLLAEDARRALAPAPEPDPGSATRIAFTNYAAYADARDVPLWSQHGEQAKAGDRISLVSDPLGQRGKVMRLECRSGDNNVAGSGSGERAEVMCSGSKVNMTDEGDILAVRCDILLRDYRSSSGDWNSVFQCHHAGSTGQSPIFYVVKNNNQLYARIWGGDAAAPSKAYLGPFSLPTASWVEVVMGFVFSSGSGARNVIYVNGSKVVDSPNRNKYVGQGNYWKQGIYRSASSFTSVLHMDDSSFFTAPTLDEAVAAALAI